MRQDTTLLGNQVSQTQITEDLLPNTAAVWRLHLKVQSASVFLVRSSSSSAHHYARVESSRDPTLYRTVEKQ
ncbi:hypothetical protein DPEC_G00166450 [Dallia pectoralis]|uniref:Uncharacterized protein n=1 Tax=Dallia pectoralis TaxID=75939 RepID=A0ACC2GI01_DALPE|nr:hypothetical protein DPEC_G00166450 [Dallia pectoralis]